MSALRLSGNQRSFVFKVLNRWVLEVPTLLSEFRIFSDYTPFHDNETSSVSVLLAAAARAGYSPVSEYRLVKRGADDLRKRRDGRADLWFGAGGLGYSFEFKRCDVACIDNLEWCMDAARYDISRIPRNEYDHGFAGLIAPLYDLADQAVYERFNRRGYTFCIFEKDVPAVYLYFQRYTE